MPELPRVTIHVHVTCDTTRSKQGFTAPYGVTTVISWDCGEVLDCEVLSKVSWESWDNGEVLDCEVLRKYVQLVLMGRVLTCQLMSVYNGMKGIRTTVL